MEMKPFDVRVKASGRMGYQHMFDPETKRYSVMFTNEQPPAEEWFDQDELEFLSH